MENFTIEPLKGYGEIPFGMTLDEAVKMLGMPNFYEELNDMEETENRSIYYEYDDLKTNIYFEGITKSVVACFETENENATLYGKKVFDLDQNAVIELMKAQGYVELEQETEDGELRVSFEDALIDFFFDEEGMTAVSWGVLVDDQGNII
ncbi:MAG: hypothetical protein MJZ91_04575 [Bacteroidales bacterium]|nr:hypothetical protein [Bacteroidales bacterium]